MANVVLFKMIDNEIDTIMIQYTGTIEHDFKQVGMGLLEEIVFCKDRSVLCL